MNTRIRRIRYKPGYIRILKNYRMVLRTAINFKNCYQIRLTRFLFKYYKFVKFKNNLIFEMSLLNIILKSTMLITIDITKEFIKNGLI